MHVFIPCRRPITGIGSFLRQAWLLICFFCQGIEDLIGIDHPVERGLELANLIIAEEFNFRIFQLPGTHAGGNF
jgi:hypothetical protein